MSNPSLTHAISLVDEHRYGEAEPFLLNLRSANPQDPLVLYYLGLVDKHFNRLSVALESFENAAKHAPKQPEIFIKLAQTLNALNRHDEALKAARKAVALDNRSKAAHLELGHTYYNLGKPVVARQSYLNALQIDPQFTVARARLAQLEKTLGNQSAAAEHLKEALQHDPNSPAVYIEAAENPELQSDPDILQNILKIIETPSGSLAPDMRAKLSFAAGKLLEKMGRLDEAFACYSDHRSDLYRPYDLQKRRQQIEALKRTFDTEFFEQRRDFGLRSEKPVFVVGMPRSGTTLIEQIIARHPKATGAGELHFFRNVAIEFERPDDHFAALGGDTPLPDPVEVLVKKAQETDTKTFRRIGQKYLNELEKHDRKASRIVDKMPHNFENLWLIALLFPNAHIIHAHREPADTCASIYTTPLNAWHNYCFDQETLGAYYGLYAELMEHWDEVLPVTIHHQSYEALISDLEGEGRTLLNYVGLSWEPSCLDFHKSDSQVFTFSTQQVRQPVYKSSIGRWKKYEPYIQPLLKALGTHAPEVSE